MKTAHAPRRAAAKTVRGPGSEAIKRKKGGKKYVGLVLLHKCMSLRNQFGFPSPKHDFHSCRITLHERVVEIVIQRIFLMSTWEYLQLLLSNANLDNFGRRQFSNLAWTDSRKRYCI